MSLVQHTSYCFEILVVRSSIHVVSVACNVPYWMLKNVPLQMAPENIRWGSAYQTLPNQVGWLSSDGAMRGTGRRSERFHDHGYHAPNGITLFNSNHIDVPNTGNLVKKVRWSRFFGAIKWKIVISVSYACVNR